MSICQPAELLSPAGRPDALRAAVQNGADAVYIGEKSFSARKNAVNFTWDEIRSAAVYCHVRGVKLHLALNTLVSDAELHNIEKSAICAAESGVDAVIVQDIGAAEVIHAVCPELPMHASTQLTAYSEADVNYLYSRGFSRVVLSRELSCDEIAEISKNTDAELEAFAHGALCICFSGRCLMSSFIGGRSGNRGMCAQPCRRKYSCGGKSAFYLSPRDLCLAGRLEDMRNAGITSFKIEGRMKSPEYVAAVTSVYRRCIDSGMPPSQEDEKLLKEIFVRGDGFTEGYFSGFNTPDIMNYDISNDNITGSVDSGLIKQLRRTFIDGEDNKKIPVHGHIILKKGEKAAFTLSDNDGNTAAASGAIPEAAVNKPLSEADLKSRMAKLGGTPFYPENISAEADGGLVLPAAELNALRRECCDKLARLRGRIIPRKTFPFDFSYDNYAKRRRQKICAQVTTAEQFAAASGADIIIVPLALWEKVSHNEKCALLLPPVIQNSAAALEKALEINAPCGTYAPSLGTAKLLSGHGIDAIGDFGLNIYNSLSARICGNICKRITVSPELSLSEIEEISAHTPAETELLAYGSQCVMVSRACLIRGIRGKCGCAEPAVLKDRTGAEFTVFGDPETHLNTVFNSRPTFAADKLAQLRKSGAAALRLCFTTESGARTKEIIAMYKGNIPPVKPKSFTRGYLLGGK